MFRTLVCSLLLASASAIAESPSPLAPPQHLTVLLSFDHPYSAQSFAAMKSQLQTVLDNVGLKLDVRDRSEVRPHAEFADLVVFQMKGYCTMDPLPIGALSDERGPLAMAYSSDGQVLPFGEVECDHIRLTLQRILGQGNAKGYQPAFGTALGFVMAHELYHMLANAPRHTRQGVTKESLSARELLAGRLSLPEIAQLAIRQGLHNH